MTLDEFEEALCEVAGDDAEVSAVWDGDGEVVARVFFGTTVDLLRVPKAGLAEAEARGEARAYLEALFVGAEAAAMAWDRHASPAVPSLPGWAYGAPCEEHGYPGCSCAEERYAG